MGFFQDITGKSAQKAAEAAAADQYAKQQAAIKKLLGYGDEYRSDTEANAAGYDPYIASYAPYSAAGTEATNYLRMLMENPQSVRSLPGYQFAQDEGIQALDRSANARSMLRSDRADKDLLRFGTGLADQTYGNQWQRLLGLSNVGLGATGAQAGLGGQQINLRQSGLTGQLGTRMSAYQGDFGSAPTIGQGMVAGANARSAGAGNIMNILGYLGGKALGAFGGLPGGAPSFGG